MSCILTFLAVSLMAFLYVVFDVNYYLRIISTLVFSRLFIKKKRPDAEFTIYGVCLPQDLDLFMRYMNDARYLRVMDYGRFQFFENSDLLTQVLKKKGNVVQGACNIRYRKAIPLLSVYKVVTKVIYWDEKALYLEQKFVTGDFVRAIALSKQHIVGVNCEDLLKNALGEKYQKPAMPEELDLWLKSIDASSAKLKKKD